MKSRKMFVPAIIFAAAIVLMAAYAIISNISLKPKITEYDFPFSITYEMDGEIVTVEDVYSVRFKGNGGYVDTSSRIYEGNIVGLGKDGGSLYLLREGPEGSLSLQTNFHADYMMGDPHYDYFTAHGFEPVFFYYDSDYNEYTDAETLAAQGVRLIDWEYPEPIENSFLFSHIAVMNSEVVVPMLIIAFLSLLAVIIFVKRDKEAPKRKINTAALILNIVVALVTLPISVFYALLSDITGSNAAFLHQLGYFIPAITVLAIAASVALRRRGYCKSGFALQFLGPVVFVLMFVILLCA